jgi:PD-(D/E)XK nuclease superfamily protein
VSVVLTTDQKGAIAELAIAHAASELGVGVFKPPTDGERYDLIFEAGSTLLAFSASGRRSAVTR